MVRRKVKIWTTENKKQRLKCRQILIVQLEHILSPFSARFWASRASEICASHSKASENTTKDEKTLCGKWEGESFLMMYLRFVNQLSQDQVPRPGAQKLRLDFLNALWDCLLSLIQVELLRRLLVLLPPSSNICSIWFFSLRTLTWIEVGRDDHYAFSATWAKEVVGVPTYSKRSLLPIFPQEIPFHAIS